MCIRDSPIGIPKLANVNYPRSRIDGSDVPAFLGLRRNESKDVIIDTRAGQRNMYRCENPSDIEIG
eukprot:10866086-Prorocentrum_lima.AAC.1